MNLALIGPLAAGKHTQAVKLTSEFDLLHVSTGNLFRAHLAGQTAMGILARQYVAQGELVPDEFVDAMIEAHVRKLDPRQDFLFDGFPRTVYQARFLDNLFAELGQRLEAVISLKVSDEVIESRVTGRIICRDCQTPYHTTFNPPKQVNRCDLCGGPLYRRDDDRPDLIKTRLNAYRRTISPLLSYYRETGRLIVVDGDGPIDQVFTTIVGHVKALEGQTSVRTSEAVYESVQPRRVTVAPLTPRQVRHASVEVVLLGGPGSGKGTQAEELSQRLDFKHISTGDIFRENLENQTELGKLAKSYMDHGDLVPDDIADTMVQERLAQSDVSGGFILDGFPRTLPQAEALTEMMNRMGRRLDVVLYLNVSDEEIIERISGRLVCRNCQTPYHQIHKPPTQLGVCDICGGELYRRDDDNPETVKQRLKIFHGQTAPLIDYYNQAGLLVEIDGEGSVEAVTDQIEAALQGVEVGRLGNSLR